MKKRTLTRRDFLKLAGAGAAVTTVLGYGVFQESNGDPIVERSPYVKNIHTSNLDGSVPILVITDQNAENRFGAYLGEILRAEGVNGFHTADLSTLKPGLLEKYEIVVLAETLLNDAQAEVFEGYVTRGGRLVGMKPADRLGAVFGLERSAGALAEGYLKTESGHPGAWELILLLCNFMVRRIYIVSPALRSLPGFIKIVIPPLNSPPFQ